MKILNKFRNLDNLIVLLISLGIFASPFVVDYSTLPKGYELPKVYFWQVISELLIILGCIKYLSLLFKTKRFIFNHDFLVPILVLFIFVVSTLISPNKDIAIHGNSFREQGLITYSLLILMTYVVYRSINPRNFHLIAIAFISSSFIQASYSFTQLYKLIQEDPKLILEGYWINGTFGQANFFSGRLLLGLIFIGYYLGRNLLVKGSWLIKTILSLVALVITFSLLISLSIWGIITSIAALIITLIYEILPKKVFTWIFYLLCIVAVVFGIIFLLKNETYNIRIDIWQNVIATTIGLPLTGSNIPHILFGWGLDTLGHVFREFGKFQGLFVDRAHNFFLDILAQNGIILLLLTLGLIAYPFIKLKKLVDDRKFVFVFLALFFWIFRSFIHESGIVNLADFLVILAGSFALMNIKLRSL